MTKIAILMSLASASLMLQSAALAQTTNFDVAGATEIYPTSINAGGTVAGYYFTTPPVTGYGKDSYGFLRDAAGNVTTITTPAFSPNNSATQVWAVNSSGVVVGDNYIVSPRSKGFLWAAGTITVLDVAGSGNVTARAINTTGQVTGTWSDPAAPYYGHGYVRDAAGGYTLFDVPPPSKTVSVKYTNPAGINDSGDIAGRFTDSTNAQHLFLRSAHGHITTYDIPGSTSYAALSLNNNGVIAGSYWNGSAQVGFTLTTSGKKVVTTFSAPGAVTYNLVNGLNSNGTVVGQYWDGANNHGYLRDSSGAFTTFDATGAVSTSATSVNDSGVSTGFFKDASNLFHGFIR